MQLIIDLPNRDDTIAFHRRRWAEVLDDPDLAGLNQRIETNAFGNIVMSPPATGPHYSKQSEIAFQLRSRLGDKVFGECPIVTSDGVKLADAAWFSPRRYEQVRGQDAFEIAPEICVEVLSPRNTAAEMRTKRTLYFDAGAIECWQCDLEGRMSYYRHDQPDEPNQESVLCLQFPKHISD